jgi:ABC-type branched-subunit amino acid transport system permease subunit
MGEDWRFFIFGVIIVVMMILRPEGMVTRQAVDRVMMKLFPKSKSHV